MTFIVSGRNGPRWLLIGLLGMFAATAAQAQVSEETAEQLMRLSGQWAQLDSSAKQMREGLVKGLQEGMTQAGTPANPDLLQRVQRAADGAFSAERLRSVTRRTLAENLRSSYVPELLAWYRTPQAQRITQAEVDDSASANDDIKARTQAGMALVQAAPPARQQLLVRMVEVTRAPRAFADFIINMGVALPLTLARFDPQAKPVTEAELRDTLEQQRPQLTQAFEIIALAGFALVYQSVPDDLLAAYASFMASSAGEHYNDLGDKALEAAVLAAIAAIKP